VCFNFVPRPKRRRRSEYVVREKGVFEREEREERG